MEAMVLVNEEVPGPKVTDEEKYEEILNQRKERKAVSIARECVGEEGTRPVFKFSNVSYSFWVLFL